MDATWEYLDSDWYSTSRALAAIILEDGTAIDLGDADTISAQFDVSSVERYRKNTATRVLGKKIANQTGVTVNLTLTQLNPVMMAAQWLGKADQFFTQAASVEPLTHTVEGYKLGRIIILPNFAFNATVTGVELGGDALDPADYRFDKMSATLQIPRKDDLEDGDVEITYTLPAVTDTAKRVYTGITQGGGVRGGLIVRQVNAEGPRKLVRFSPGLFMPTSVNLVGGDELDTHEFTMSPEADPSAGAGFELGRMLDITDAVLAI